MSSVTCVTCGMMSCVIHVTSVMMGLCVHVQASTSELYGKVQEIPQKETTPFYPRSPYGELV